MKLPTDNLSYPVRIIIGASSGSGFLVRHFDDLYFVTAKHVLYQLNPLSGELKLFDNSLQLVCHLFLNGKTATAPRIYQLNLDALRASNDLKVHKDADIVIIRLGTIKTTDGNQTVHMPDSVKIVKESEGSLVHCLMSTSRKFNDVEITNDVFVLGYPSSLSTPEMKHIDYNSPLARKGIVAGKNSGNKTLVLDCPVYGGNSGGLVLEQILLDNGLVSISLAGMIVQFVPFIDQWSNIKFPALVNSNFQNSGYSIALPVDYIYDLISEIKQ